MLATVTLPDVGVDVVGIIVQMVASLGPVAGTAVAGCAAFLVVVRGCEWLSVAGGEDRSYAAMKRDKARQRREDEAAAYWAAKDLDS